MAASLSPAEVESYLHRHIPLSAGMGVRVVACGPDGVRLGAPLAPNLNHRATAFGGSVSAVAILSAWTWLYVALHGIGIDPRLVIQRNRIEYLAPITADFEARCAGLDRPGLEKFVRSLRRLGRARMTLATEVSCGGKVAARFEGDYVALRVD